MEQAYSITTFEHMGYTFEMSLYYDEDMGAPWEEHDGHGIVSDWTSRNKSPGEWILASDRNSKRFYDYAETLKVAKRGGWGIGDETKLAGLERRLGHKPTKREITDEAVRLDYEWLKAWCEDKWFWVGVCVTSKELGETEPFHHAVWGVESKCAGYGHKDCYHMETAKDYAEEIIGEWRERQAEVLA